MTIPANQVSRAPHNKALQLTPASWAFPGLVASWHSTSYLRRGRPALAGAAEGLVRWAARVNDQNGGHLHGKPELAQYARARRAGSLLFLAGISSRLPDNTVKGASIGSTGALQIDIRAQTEGCVENLKAALDREGLQLSSLVDVTVFLVSMADYGGFNEAWTGARCCILAD